ncbi:MAG: hypothetical protein ACM3NN_10715, partial [Nitrospirota bacterium]
KGGTMKKRFVKLALFSAVLFAAAPVFAQSVDEKIQALEQELSQLKDQQVELKKEATAAAAAMPTFSFRPGNGVMIEAADKSWALRSSLEAHFRMLFESGISRVGRTSGEIMGRRLRPYFYYCVNNCLFETEVGLDLDGFGTGNAKNSLNTGGNSILQRAAVHINFQDLNPWLPTLDTGMDISTTGAAAISRQGSSATGVQREYDLMTRNVSMNTGRAGQGINLRWDNRSLSGIGIPGRISRFSVAMASISEGDDGLSSFKDAGGNFDGYLGINPFSQLKNKWLSGLLVEFGAWFCNNRGYRGNIDNGCDRVRVQDHGDGGRQALFDTGSDSVGKGWYRTFSPGIAWTVGPYRLRAMGMWLDAQDKATAASTNSGRDKTAHNFLIGHDLFVWSPKGFLTGSATTPGSILVGYSFERNDLSCDTCTGTHFAQFHRNRIILNQWGLAYFFASRMSVLANILWYDASNLRVGAGQACANLGVCNSSGSGRSGRGGEWVDGSITLRVDF